MLFYSGKIIVVVQRYPCSIPGEKLFLCEYAAFKRKDAKDILKPLFFLNFSLVHVLMIQAAWPIFVCFCCLLCTSDPSTYTTNHCRCLMEGQLKVTEWALTAQCMSFGDSTWVVETCVCNAITLKAVPIRNKKNPKPQSISNWQLLLW